MKRFFLSTTGRLLIGCLVVIIVVGIGIAAVTSKKKKSATNETTVNALQEESETSVLGSDLPKEETTIAVSEATTSGTKETEISQEESSTSTTTGTSATTQVSTKPSEPAATTTKPSEPAVTKTKPSETAVTTTQPANPSVPVTTTTEPENLSEVDLYYQSISTVISSTKADESTDVLTEAEAAEVFGELGFDQYPITYDYSMGGEYKGYTEITNDSNTKHPKYQTYFMTDSGNLYNIFLINGVVLAYPVSFNMESDLEAELVISESNELTIYSNKAHKFYVIIPYKSNTIVKLVDKISAETLSTLTNEEIKDYES